MVKLLWKTNEFFKLKISANKESVELYVSRNFFEINNNIFIGAALFIEKYLLYKEAEKFNIKITPISKPEINYPDINKITNFINCPDLGNLKGV